MSLIQLKRSTAAMAGDSTAVVERVWALALARAAQEELGIALSLGDCRLQRRTLGELGELLPEPALIAALDEGAGEATGVLVVDAGLMAGMVEALTTGMVTALDRAGRRPTRTDAALLAPVLDRALAGFEAAAAEADLTEWARGFRFAATVDGGRALSLMLEDVEFRVLLGEVDLAGGARKGRLILAVPDGLGGGMAEVRPPVDTRFAEALAERVAGAEVRLDAVLMRLSMPLGAVMALRVGQEVALPLADIGQIGLEGLDGRRVGAGRLGRQGTARAVRLAGEAEERPQQTAVAVLSAGRM